MPTSQPPSTGDAEAENTLAGIGEFGLITRLTEGRPPSQATLLGPGDDAAEIAGITGVVSAEDVTGPYDVIVRAEADDVDLLGKLVVAQVQGVNGITRTLTCPVVHLS